MIGRTHLTFRTPWAAILTAMPIIAGVPIALVLYGVSPERGLTDLFTLGAYGYLGAYVLASASLPLFLRRIGEGTWSSWALGGATAAAVIFLVWNAVTVSAQEGNVQAVVYGSVVTLSVLYAQFLRWRSPAHLVRVRIYDETREPDLHSSNTRRKS